MKQGIFKKLPALYVAYPCSAIIKINTLHRTMLRCQSLC